MSADLTLDKISREQHDTIRAIAERAVEIAGRQNIDVSPLDVTLDIIAVHNTVGLRLAELVNADSFNFTHDVFGIIRHLDRETGKLLDCFSPRYARR